MKGFMKEFKEFINRGNVMDMAVGIIIGTAFTAIVKALVDSIVMPLISRIFGGLSFEKWNVALGAGKDAPVLGFGTLVEAIINFLLIAIVVFSVIKAINKAAEKAKELKGAEEEPEEAPTTKVCPFCKSEIAIDATRCPHCTSELSE